MLQGRSNFCFRLIKLCRTLKYTLRIGKPFHAYATPLPLLHQLLKVICSTCFPLCLSFAIAPFPTSYLNYHLSKNLSTNVWLSTLWLAFHWIISIYKLFSWLNCFPSHQFLGISVCFHWGGKVAWKAILRTFGYDDANYFCITVLGIVHFFKKWQCCIYSLTLSKQKWGGILFWNVDFYIVILKR